MCSGIVDVNKITVSSVWDYCYVKSYFWNYSINADSYEILQSK